MNKLSEKKIIELFQNKLGNASFVPEDVESFKIGKKRLIVKVDTLVESTDLPPGMKLEDAARKSIVSCVSDFAAKGVKANFWYHITNNSQKIFKVKHRKSCQGISKCCKRVPTKNIGRRYE